MGACSRWRVLLAAVAGAGIASAAAAGGPVSTQLSGYFNESQENACIHVSKVFFLTDCMYAPVAPEIAGSVLPWTGPTVNPVYYERGSAYADPDYEPVPGDGRIAPTMEAILTIDDQGTADLADDTVSGTLIVGSAARTVVANVNELAGGVGGAPPRAVISWSRIVHTLAATPVTTAESDGKGGRIYTIGSRGVPQRLCRQDDPEDCFPSANAPRTTDGPGVYVWAEPGGIGITRDTAMDGNVGANTTAFMMDYRCEDNRGGIVCPSHNVVWRNGREPLPGERNLSEAPGFDNLLLRIHTDADGYVRSVAGFWTQEYYLEAGPAIFDVPEGHDNSWQGGFLQLAPAAEARR